MYLSQRIPNEIHEWSMRSYSWPALESKECRLSGALFCILVFHVKRKRKLQNHNNKIIMRANLSNETQKQRTWFRKRLRRSLNEWQSHTTSSHRLVIIFVVILFLFNLVVFFSVNNWDHNLTPCYTEIHVIKCVLARVLFFFFW